MNTSAFFAVFPRQLRFWTFHCIVNALPSFCIASVMLNLKDSPTCIIAMLAGIGSFILFYALLTSIPGPLADKRNLLARSLTAGTKIRSWFVGICALLIIFKVPLFLVDFSIGTLAVRTVEETSRAVSPGGLVTSIDSHSSFLHIYMVTILDGMLLSIVLLTLSFVALVVLQGRERRKFFRQAARKQRSAARS
jgi:hypothetical protein